MAHEKITETILKNFKYNFYVFIGGDHSITYATFKAIKHHFENILLINIDKHFDIRDWSKDNISSGSSFSRLLDEGIIKANELLEIGILEFFNSDYLFEKLKRYGFEYIKMFEIKENIDGVLNRIEKKLEAFKNIYLSIDIDVIDASICPGSSASSHFGLYQEELLKILNTIINSRKLIALDVVEVNPLVDFNDMSSRFSSLLLSYLINQII